VGATHQQGKGWGGEFGAEGGGWCWVGGGGSKREKKGPGGGRVGGIGGCGVWSVGVVESGGKAGSNGRSNREMGRRGLGKGEKPGAKVFDGVRGGCVWEGRRVICGGCWGVVGLSMFLCVGGCVVGVCE